MLTRFGSFTALAEFSVELGEIEKISTSTPLFEPLVSLNISFNGIAYINALFFKSMHNLKMLKLNKNNLKLIEAGAFSSLVKLEELNLEENHLKKVNNLFDSLLGLIRLNLSSNNVERLNENAFYKLKLVKQIELVVCE
jgi:hypothetical protein